MNNELVELVSAQNKAEWKKRHRQPNRVQAPVGSSEEYEKEWE